MHTFTWSYYDGQHELEAFVASPDKIKCPVVILCHGWAGRDSFICEKARELAEWGYLGFCLDMYGKGILGSSKEENAALKLPFIEDRALLERRLLRAFEIASSLPNAKSNQIAVLGFGFGGLCALDLARTNADIKGAVSIYGHFSKQSASISRPIKTKILILHGYDDPIVSQTELHHFMKELNDNRVDWQAQIFGGTMHAFATPGTNFPKSGLLYNSSSAMRSWAAVRNFLGEIFLSP